MSATELATVIEGWATLIGLFVVIAGAVFAGVQLRADAKARKLEAMIAVLSNIRPPEVNHAWRVVDALPQEFNFRELDAISQDAVLTVMASYGRLGNLLEAGMVAEDDIFPHTTLSRGAIDAWEKVKHIPRSGQGYAPLLPSSMFNEVLAARAEAWLERNGLRRFGNLPVFDADPNVIERVGTAVKEARAAAS